MFAVLLIYCALGLKVRATDYAGTVCEIPTQVEGGWICGLIKRTASGEYYASFKGVPYAQQPTGELRFKELQPIKPWHHHLDATQEGPVCPQHDEIYGTAHKPTMGMSEACIYANIYIPLGESHAHKTSMSSDGFKRRGLPILVFIHGGGFQIGSSNSDIHGPDYLISKGVMVITFNYRLNVFGFLSLNTSEVPGNNGLRDQVTFLRWVQRNANRLGGNPEEVTLMGHSAGSTAAHLLSLSAVTKGLFKRVILLSGTGIPSYYTTSPIYAQNVTAQFLIKLGIQSTDPVEIHKLLIEMPLERIMEANSAVQYDTGLVSFTPVVESKFPGVTRVLDDEPINLIKCGRDKEIPLIIGMTNNEVEVFRWRLEYLDILQRIKINPLVVLSPRLVYSLPPTVSLELARKVHNYYFKGNPTMDKFVYLASDTYLVYPAFKLAQWRAEMYSAPVYLYQFSYESKFNVMKKALWLDHYKGATHIEDITFIFRVNSIIGRKTLPESDKLMVEWMTSFIVNFMRCNDPTCSKDTLASPWPRVYDNNTLNYQDISAPMVISNASLTKYQREMIRFHDSLDVLDGNINATCTNPDNRREQVIH